MILRDPHSLKKVCGFLFFCKGVMKMNKSCNIAIAGATGEVGRALLAMLEEAELAIDRIYVLASERSEEQTVMYKNRPLLVEMLSDFDFALVQFVILALPAEVSLLTAERARDAGCRVIDHSAAFRADESVPLILDGAAEHLLENDLVACPGAAAAMLAPLLSAVDELAGIEVAHMTLLSPVSAAGNAGVRELAGQTGELLNARGIDAVVFPAQIAFNCLPLVGSSAADAAPEAEVLLKAELDRLLERPLSLVVSLVQVPVFYGLSAMVSVQTEAPLDLVSLRHSLSQKGVVMKDPELDQGVATPVTDAAGHDEVYMSGLRSLPSPLQGLQFWVTVDNVRYGAARHSLFVLRKWIKDFKY